jgi:hypothetical protein
MVRRRQLPFVATVATLLIAGACGDDSVDTTQIASGVPGDAPPVTDPAGPTAPDGPGTDPSAGDGTGADLPAVLLIMDASGSMNATGPDGSTLLEGARNALVDVVEGLPDEQHVGLRVYGHTVPNTDQVNGCRDTELIHPVGPLDRPALLDSITTIEARGFTPIGLSLEEGAADLPPEGARTLILVSDGEETCGTDPCTVADQLRSDGIELVIHTVGFALGDNQQAREELGCIADVGGGRYVEVDEADALADAIDDAARDDRTFAADGSELAGAPVPRDAVTGQVDTYYTDTVLGADGANYYRFEVPPGSTVRAEVMSEPNPAFGESCRRHGLWLWADVTDRSGTGLTVTGADYDTGNPATEALVAHSADMVVEDGEAWVEVRSRTNTCDDGDDIPLNVELALIVVD